MSDPKPSNPESSNDEQAEAIESIPLGPCGKALLRQEINITPLGNDGGGIEMLGVPGEILLEAGKVLRDELEFDLLLSVSGVDRKDYRESVTHLYSTKTHQYIALKTQADENEKVPSLMPVWHAADWHERETYDLMGIIYEGHESLQRILMPNDWIGHPLRKDYKEDDPRLVWNRR